MQNLFCKRQSKKDKETSILLGVVDLYIKKGTPIGSNTLKENGFSHLSSATIRNYFAQLEKKGFLHQQHTSGGRTPTTAAFRKYVDSISDKINISKKQKDLITKEFKTENNKVSSYIQQTADKLSEITKLTVFISSPRFDQDFIQDVKLLRLDSEQLLAVIITNFGVIKTEILITKTPLEESNIKQIEAFFLWRLSKKDNPNINESLLKCAQRLYNELMVRYFVGYANYPMVDVYKTGLSKLLSYNEFKDPTSLAYGLGLLENPVFLQLLLNDATNAGKIHSYLAEEMLPLGISIPQGAITTIPYKINQIICGAIAVLGPLRIPYKNIFEIMHVVSKEVSHSITNMVYKFKLSYRNPSNFQVNVEAKAKNLLDYSPKKNQEF